MQQVAAREMLKTTTIKKELFYFVVIDRSFSGVNLVALTLKAKQRTQKLELAKPKDDESAMPCHFSVVWEFFNRFFLFFFLTFLLFK